MALGNAIRSSALLEDITGMLRVISAGDSLWTSVLLFVVFMTVISSVISHTISAIICLPLIAQIGLEFGHCRLFVILCCMMYV